MNPISSDIFGRLDWLTKRIKGLFGAVGLIKNDIDTINSDIIDLQNNKLSSVSTDGVSLQGNGTSGNPLSANMTTENVLYGGSGTVDLTAINKNFFFITLDPIALALDPGDIVLPNYVDGKKFIIINMCGASLTNTGPQITNIENTLDSQILPTSRLHEFIGYNGKWMLVRFQEI